MFTRDIWIIGFLLAFYSYFGISSHVWSEGIVPVLFLNTMTIKIWAINSSLIRSSQDTKLWGMEDWKFLENGKSGTSIISNENYSLFFFAGQRWLSWSILNPVYCESLEGDQWSQCEAAIESTSWVQTSLVNLNPSRSRNRWDQCVHVQSEVSKGTFVSGMIARSRCQTSIHDFSWNC